MSSWRDIDHVRQALGEKLIPRAQPPKHLLREVEGGGRYAPHQVSPDQEFGELTTVSIVERFGRKGTVWLCRCSCGETALRASGQLTRSVRLGHKPSCHRCRLELMRGARANRYASLHEAFRKQYVDRRTLWTGGQTGWLMIQTRLDLEAAMGPMIEVTPKLPLEYEAGWPWSPSDKDTAIRIAYKERLEATDSLEDLADEREEGRTTARLALAVQSGEREELDEALREDAKLKPRKHRRRNPESEHSSAPTASLFRVPDPWPQTYSGLQIKRCVGCGQRLPWHAGIREPACNTSCIRRRDERLAYAARELQKELTKRKNDAALEKAKRQAELDAEKAERAQKKNDHAVNSRLPHYRPGLKEETVSEEVLDLETAAAKALLEGRETSISAEDKARIVERCVSVLSCVPEWKWRPMPNHPREHVLVFWCSACNSWPAVTLAPNTRPWRHNAPPACEKCSSKKPLMFIGIGTFDGDKKTVSWNGEVVWRAPLSNHDDRLPSRGETWTRIAGPTVSRGRDVVIISVTEFPEKIIEYSYLPRKDAHPPENAMLTTSTIAESFLVKFVKKSSSAP